MHRALIRRAADHELEPLARVCAALDAMLLHDGAAGWLSRPHSLLDHTSPSDVILSGEAECVALLLESALAGGVQRMTPSNSTDAGAGIALDVRLFARLVALWQLTDAEQAAVLALTPALHTEWRAGNVVHVAPRA